jgi:hypothetical protein
MEELMDLLSEAGVKRTSDSMSLMPQTQSGATMIENLLSSFNNNPRNSRVIEYIFRQNLFDMIGKSRHEMVHSRMIAELLAGRFFDLSKKATLMHFFDIVVMRAKEQGINIPQEFCNAILTRSLQIDSLDDKQTEYPLCTYKNDKRIDTKERLDIYLRYNLAFAIKSNDGKRGKKVIEIFIENKVLSREHDQQTQTYYDTCVEGRKGLQLFIYLSPISQRDLTNYSSVPENMKPVGSDRWGNPVYVHVCYQDILDKVISPLIEEKQMNKRDAMILDEYASCLELPALPDDDDKLSAKELSIMAVSNYEKEMLTEFMNNEDNAKLLEAAVSHRLQKNLYSFAGVNCLSFDQSLQAALRMYTSENGELKSLKAFMSILGAQNGGARFLIYAVTETDEKLYYIPTDLIEYNGKAYKNITEALKDAIKDYISRTNKSTQEVINDFKCLYAKQKDHQNLFKDTPEPIRDVHYSQTPFTGLYIRDKITKDKLSKINDILGDGFGLKTISDECYQKLIHSGDYMLCDSCDKKLFNSLHGTHYFYRKGAESRIKAINSILQEPIQESSLSKVDCELLERFYANNSKLILSIYRILIENEQDMDVYKQRSDDYKKLLRV